MDKKVKIPILDLKREYVELKRGIAQEIKSCFSTQHWILGDKVEYLESKIAEYLGVQHACGVASGTDALILALRAFALLRHGREFFSSRDEIITTPFTFISSAEAIILAGAKPVFVDVDPITFNISASAIQKAITKNTVGIIPVHLFGLSCAMDDVMDISRKHNLFVLEDVAQAFGGRYKNKKLGSIGHAGAFSFFPSKNLGCYGDGGLIASNDKALMSLIALLRNHGQARSYDADHIGYNSRLDALQAAVLLAKLTRVEDCNKRRRANASYYRKSLQGITQIELPQEMQDYYHVYNLFTLRVFSKRDELCRHLCECGVDARVYYPLLVSSMKAYRHCKIQATPNAQRIIHEVLSIPGGPFMKDVELRRVSTCIRDFFKNL